MTPSSSSLPLPLETPAETSVDSVPAESTTDEERNIIFVTSLGHALCHIGELVFAGVISAVIVEFSLAPHQATALALLGYMLLGVGALPFGLWADRWGPRRVLLIYFFAMAAASVGVALSTSILQLFVALTVLGLAASMYHPAGLAMISLGVRSRGRALGINGVAGSVGVACGPLLGMLAAGMGMWRLAYVVLAGLSLIGGCLMYLSQRRLRAALLRNNGSDAGAKVGANRLTVGPLLSQEVPRRSWQRYLPLTILMAAMMLGGFNYRCLVTALPTYLSGAEASGSQLFQGGIKVFVVLLVGGIGQYVGGWAADRFGAKVYPALLCFLVPLAVVLGFLEGTSFAFLVAGFLAVFLFAQQPIENVLLADWTTKGRRSLSYATKFAFTFGIGALGAQATGLIWHEYNSLAPVFFFLGCSGVVMILLFFLATRVRQNLPQGERGR